jgi:hypothetical protein
MFLELGVTILASAVIGWNFGIWLIPASWLALLFAVVALTSVPGARGMFAVIPDRGRDPTGMCVWRSFESDISDVASGLALMAAAQRPSGSRPS